MEEKEKQSLRNIQYFLEGYNSGREQKTLINKNDPHLIFKALHALKSQEDQINNLKDEVLRLTKLLSNK